MLFFKDLSFFLPQNFPHIFPNFPQVVPRNWYGTKYKCNDYPKLYFLRCLLMRPKSPGWSQLWGKIGDSKPSFSPTLPPWVQGSPASRWAYFCPFQKTSTFQIHQNPTIFPQISTKLALIFSTFYPNISKMSPKLNPSFPEFPPNLIPNFPKIRAKFTPKTPLISHQCLSPNFPSIPPKTLKLKLKLNTKKNPIITKMIRIY